MGGSRLTPAEIEKRDRENKKYSTLFQRIKKLFNNREVKALLGHLKSSLFLT
jgi:hypothetical protein